MNKTIEERITELERRFYPIETVLYQTEFRELIETQKNFEIKNNGNKYFIEVNFQTDKGTYTKVFEVSAYTEKQALFFCDRDILTPNLTELKRLGKIRWYKIINKKVKF
jgi:hypothetical protein